MKNRILTFIIGLLVGAILTITGFLIYSREVAKSINGKMPFENNRPIQGQNRFMEEPPPMPENM